MRNMKRIVTCATGVLAFTAAPFLHSADQTINFTVPQLLLFSVDGGAITLDVSSELTLESGGAAATVSDDTSSYNFFLLGQPTTAKVTAELDADMPTGTILSATLGTDGVEIRTPTPFSEGKKELSTTPVNVVTSINNGASFGATLTYEFTYDPSLADLDVTNIPSVVVTYTMSAE